MPFMGTDLGKVMKLERLSEDRVQFLVYQMLRGLKVSASTRPRTRSRCRVGDGVSSLLSTSTRQGSSTGYVTFDLRPRELGGGPFLFMLLGALHCGYLYLYPLLKWSQPVSL